MLCWILAVTIPIYAGALYLSYQSTAQRLETDAERDADELAGRLAAGLDAVIRPIEGGIRTVAHQLEEIDPPRTEYPRRIRGILAAWPEVYGSTIAVAPSDGSGDAAADGSVGAFAPYFFRRGDAVEYADLARDSYAYRELPWFRRAADAERPVWSLPYFDAGGGETWMVTYSTPFHRKRSDGRRVLAGVVTADLALDWVRRTTAQVRLASIGMGWLTAPPTSDALRPPSGAFVAPSGAFVAPKGAFVAPIGATAERIAAFGGALDEAAMREAGEAMLARKITFGVLPAGVTPRPAYLAVRNLQTLDWRLMLVLPRAALLAEAHALLERQLFLGAVGLLLLVAAIWLVANGIARPIHALATAVGAVNADDAELELPEARRSDEIGVLTDALRRMRGSLQRHIQLRAEGLAERARMDQELAIAAGIQQSMLPRRDAAADLPAAIEVAAALRPAKQVGGDLYDYFTTGDGNVFFAIGDVSDKGIPAALFMARMSALLRVLGAAGAPPDRLLAEINTRLVDGNDACMFVTLGCGVLDVRTGRIRYASAGHEPPFVRNAEGTVRLFHADNGAALGIDDGADYPPTEGWLAPGDTLVLFTDGLSEAEADDGTLFGVDRVAELLGDAPDGDADTIVRPSAQAGVQSSAQALVQSIVDTVGTDASGFHATDDLTVLALGFRPPEVRAQRAEGAARWVITPDATADGIRRTQHWLDAILAARDVGRERRDDVELIVEELLTNVVRAAEAAGRAVRLAIECALTPSEITLTFRDDGTRFDPTARERPRLDADIADRDIGGLGILLVQRLADTCRYARIGDENVLEVRLHRNADEHNRGVPCH